MSILARNSLPLRYRNPDLVYSAHWRPVRDLYRGYLARPAKKLLNAACWCRIACCSGTEEARATPARVRLAWTLAQHVLAIQGTSQLPAHLAENIGAGALHLAAVDLTMIATVETRLLTGDPLRGR